MSGAFTPEVLQWVFADGCGSSITAMTTRYREIADDTSLQLERNELRPQRRRDRVSEVMNLGDNYEVCDFTQGYEETRPWRRLMVSVNTMS